MTNYRIFQDVCERLFEELVKELLKDRFTVVSGSFREINGNAITQHSCQSMGEFPCLGDSPCDWRYNAKAENSVVFSAFCRRDRNRTYVS